MTYLLISLPFLLLAAGIWTVFARRFPYPLATTAAVGATILILTAVFDNLMIWAGFVGYGQEQRLGWRIGLVPIEDFFYAIFVVLVLSALWKGSNK